MVVMPCLFEEDARDGVIGSYGRILKDPPCYLKCQAGVSIKDTINSYGIDNNNIYATAIVKWLLPKDRRNKPTSQEIKYGEQYFKEELLRVKPKLVICLGKAGFNFFSPYAFKEDDVAYGVFWSEEYNCYYVLMPNIQALHMKPFMLDQYKVGMKEAISLLKETYGIDRGLVKRNYQVINNSEELLNFTLFLKKNNIKLLSVDCEWRGLHPWNGDLRSLQVAWAPGQAVYIRFMDDKCKYVFDSSYAVAGEILKMHLSDPEVKFVGHHFAADAVWLEQTLGIDTYERCYLDTEFASQCIDEHRALGLEDISMRYTDLGRYEMELMLWKKTAKMGPLDGYGYVPDDIMIPYAMKDVDAVIRAVPFIVKELEEQNLTDYYFNYFNKFVTDVFVHFTTTGLKIDRGILEDLRELYGFAKIALEKKFITCIAEEAELLLEEYATKLGIPKEQVLQLPVKIIADSLSDDVEKITAFFEHYNIRNEFNFRSGVHMKRWLFDVKRFVPFKSTQQKDKGRPSTSWDKVLQLPKEQQKLYVPSADKQTLNIFATQDALVARLVGLNLVGNIFKMCLKPAEVDDEGNVVKENGLFFFLDKNDIVHGNFSSTETG